MKKNALAKRIKQARTEMKLTQSDLAYRMGISAQSISAFESGRIPPSREHVEKIAQFTHKPLYFFTGQRVMEVMDRLEKVAKEITDIKEVVSQLIEQDEGESR
jgi:transcriptional regulator with XRE-family HTH domain